MNGNPYAPPRAQLSADVPYEAWELPTPAVYGWYRLYVGVMLAFHVLLMVLAFGLSASGSAHVDSDVMLGLGLFVLVFSVPWLAALLLRRTPGAWVYHLVLICLGMTGITVVASVPLLVYWIKPETKRFFGRADGGR